MGERVLADSPATTDQYMQIRRKYKIVPSILHELTRRSASHKTVELSVKALKSEYLYSG